MNSTVISREDVYALLQGFETQLRAAPEAASHGVGLTPGQRVTPPLEMRSRPSRMPSDWRTTARPMEAWPFAQPRSAASSMWLRHPTAHMEPALLQADYWPAYADVLTNVVLNLLFLVGLLTMGLVVLNYEVIGAEMRLSEQRAQVMLVQQRVGTTALARVTGGSMDSGSLVDSPLLGAVPGPVPTPAASLPAPPTAPPLIAAQTVAAAARPQREFTLRRETANALVAAVVQAAAPVVTASAGSAAESAAVAVTGGRHVGTLTFELRETRWPQSRPLVGADSLTPADRRALVAFAPPDNRRLMAEAFSRLSSVREAMIVSGVPARHIDLRIAPVPPGLASDDIAPGTVYVINLGGS